VAGLGSLGANTTLLKAYLNFIYWLGVSTHDAGAQLCQVQAH
jgi:hypothetical protein